MRPAGQPNGPARQTLSAWDGVTSVWRATPTGLDLRVSISTYNVLGSSDDVVPAILNITLKYRSYA